MALNAIAMQTQTCSQLIAHDQRQHLTFVRRGLSLLHGAQATLADCLVVAAAVVDKWHFRRLRYLCRSLDHLLHLAQLLLQILTLTLLVLQSSSQLPVLWQGTHTKGGLSPTIPNLPPVYTIIAAGLWTCSVCCVK